MREQTQQLEAVNKELELLAYSISHDLKAPLRSIRGLSEVLVERKPSGYVVRGERVEHLIERTNLDSESGLARFQSQLDRLGVNAALEAAGVKPGDTVRIAGVEFEYQP